MQRLYRVFAYFGVGTVFGSMLYGFRHAPDVPATNVAVDLAWYGFFAIPHLIMTRAWFKAAVYGSPSGSLRERQVYIVVTTVTWLIVLALHRPLPSGTIVVPPWISFAAHVGFLLSFLAFFEGVTFERLDGLLGVPGSALTHSHGTETPLLTEGSYASVRHPMYRAAILGGLCSIVMHPHPAQVFWVMLIGATFVAFIPVEEAQLLAARGDAYRRYMEVTRWRVMRGIW